MSANITAMKPLDKDGLAEALAIEDLTENSEHSLGLMVEEIRMALAKDDGYPEPQIWRGNRISTIGRCMEALYMIKKGTAAAGMAYTKYILPIEKDLIDQKILRVHTTEAAPDILQMLSGNEVPDALYMVPGLCYRRDQTDKIHTGTPHQMDIWRVVQGRMTRENLLELIRTVLGVVCPDLEYRCNETSHPYTEGGLEVEVYVNGEWMEILECGLILPQLLADNGLDPEQYSGLALGMGLDRAVMLRKGIDDIRLLRHSDSRIARQMKDLEKYVPVSNQPEAKRDISICVSKGWNIETLTEVALDALEPDEVSLVESITVESETEWENIPEKARNNMKMKKSQKNLLVRIIMRDHVKSIPKKKATGISGEIHKAINHKI